MHVATRAAIAASVVALLATAAVVATSGPAHPIASASVKVMAAEGHGSGVHIGGGLFLTAAHVVTEGVALKVRTNGGVDTDSEVLWTNKRFDIALIHSPQVVAKVAALACVQPAIGDRLTGEGNPYNFEHVTVRGEAVSKSGVRGPWAHAFVASMSVFGGMSGGPVYDRLGRAVGIIVGMLRGTSFAIIVPGAAICPLLARA
jgi:S1-C subfamily serine protease